jgi:hypothetical protein
VCVDVRIKDVAYNYLLISWDYILFFCHILYYPKSKTINILSESQRQEKEVNAVCVCERERE